MYKSRINQLKQMMQRKKIEVAFITSPENIYYFTGFYSNPFERFLALVVYLDKEENSLFLPMLDLQSAEENSHNCKLIPVKDSDDPYEILCKIIPAQFSASGLEKSKISLLDFEKFASVYPDVKYVDMDEHIMKLRIIKSPDEVAHIKQAISITNVALNSIKSESIIGKTEIEISAQIQYQTRLLGADRPSSPLVLSGERAALPHGRTSKKKIGQGDFLLIDFTVFINGYYSDITRTFIVGEANDRQREVYDTVLRANEKAIAAIEAGEKLSVIDRTARNYIRLLGYGDRFTHRVGHGLGMDMHEIPSIHENNHDEILPGMSFTVEPGIYIPEFGGVRIEDDIYIGLDGQKHVLSSSIPKELTILN